MTVDSLVTTTSSEVGIPLDATYTPTVGSTYWVVIRSSIANGEIQLIADLSTDIYTSGQLATSSDAGSNWTAGTYDIYFRAITCP